MKYLMFALLSFSVLANDMVILKKGDQAPFDGILSNQEQMAKFRKTDEQNKLLEQQNIKLKDLADISDQRIELYKQEVKTVREDLSSSQRKTFWSSVGFFALGAVITGLCAKVAIESTR